VRQSLWGLETILEARRILLLASGRSQSGKAVAKIDRGPNHFFGDGLRASAPSGCYFSAGMRLLRWI